MGSGIGAVHDLSLNGWAAVSRLFVLAGLKSVLVNAGRFLGRRRSVALTSAGAAPPTDHSPATAVEPSALSTVVGRTIALSHDRRLASLAARQVADALLTHFDNADEFWELVYLGDGTVVSLPPGEPEAILPAGRIVVHVAGSLVPGQSGVLRTRDLVMSALGCGIACGQNLEELLRQPWRELRFFLCSPLAETPVPVAASVGRIRPRETEAFFPEVDARSAALSQLLLAMLRRVRS